jgi:hypothetical protein
MAFVNALHVQQSCHKVAGAIREATHATETVPSVTLAMLTGEENVLSENCTNVSGFACLRPWYMHIEHRSPVF